VAIDGAFDRIESRPGFVWDTSSLYDQGIVTLIQIPAPGTLGPATLGFVAFSRRRSRR
jgi:hypothetical protein